MNHFAGNGDGNRLTIHLNGSVKDLFLGTPFNLCLWQLRPPFQLVIVLMAALVEVAMGEPVLGQKQSRAFEEDKQDLGLEDA